jgi:hypothetical protein
MLNYNTVDEDLQSLLKAVDGKSNEMYHAIMAVTPVLSQKVLEHGRLMNDNRSLLEMTQWDKAVKYVRATTQEFRLMSEYMSRMTVPAHCQMLKINGASYPVPEMISMMLEQCDYWEQDAYVILEMAVAYINGEFDKK